MEQSKSGRYLVHFVKKPARRKPLGFGVDLSYILIMLLTGESVISASRSLDCLKLCRCLTVLLLSFVNKWFVWYW